METDEELLAECAANPDDDAPRLVWADRVGGERGELVVIQCDLARGGLTVAESRARRVREYEMLDEHAVAWAGGLPAKRWNFRRGFIEAARFAALPALDAWPLLRSVTIDNWPPDKHGDLDRLRALGVLQLPRRLPVVPELRALLVHELDSPLQILDLVSAAPIETLRLRMHRLQRFAIETILGACPRLVALELSSLAVRDDDGVDVAAAHPLRALQLGLSRIRTISHLVGSRAAATIEHFGFDLHGDPVDLADILSGMPRVRTLDIGGNVEAAARAIVDATMPALHLVRIRGDVAPSVVGELALRAHVDLSTIEDELVHASPAAMGTLGRPWCEWSKRAVLARLDRLEIFDIPMTPVDEVLHLGRSMNTTIRIMSGTVARHHASLRWHDGAHEIEDLQSTNGILVEGQRVQRHVLRDGEDLQLGEAMLRYFIGDDARDRAVAFVSGLSTR